MSHNEEFLYKQIKELRNVVTYLLSILGRIMTITTSGGQIMATSGRPVIAPLNPLVEAIAVDHTAGAFYCWNINTQLWDAFLL